MEDSIYSFATEYIKRLFKDINTNLLRKFNALFKKDEAGKHRDWKTMEEGEIRELHAKCKLALEDIIKQFKFINIPKPGTRQPIEKMTAGEGTTDFGT